MSGGDVKAELHDYLRGARDTLVWKLDGLGEYDIRRPLTQRRVRPSPRLAASARQALHDRIEEAARLAAGG